MKTHNYSIGFYFTGHAVRLYWYAPKFERETCSEELAYNFIPEYCKEQLIWVYRIKNYHLMPNFFKLAWQGYYELVRKIC
jgi:hypothetical protein